MPTIDPQLEGFTRFLRTRIRGLKTAELKVFASRYLGDEIGYEDACEVVLAELARRHFGSSRFHPYLLHELLDELDIKYTDEDLSQIASILSDNNSATLQGTILPDESAGKPVQLSAEGYVKGLSILERYLAGMSSIAMASDRVVTIEHNSPGYSELVYALQELGRRIRTGNEETNFTPEEQEIAASEVNQLEIALSGHAVRLEDFLRRARMTLGWILDHAGGAMIGALALAVVKAIELYFGVTLF